MAQSLKALFVPLLLVFLSSWTTLGAQRPEPVTFAGRVVSVSGDPISGATIIAPGGLLSWAETDSDGRFDVESRAAFISVRHRQFKPALAPVDGDPRQIEIRLEPIDKSVWRLPRCRDSGLGSRPYIGGGLSVRVPGRRYRGPTYGDHDAHWFIDFTEDESLHVLTGLNQHAGLPVTDWLIDSTNLHYRGWVSGEQYGLDVSGETSNGRKWRWVGAMLDDAVSYYGVSDEAASFFDSIIETACLG